MMTFRCPDCGNDLGKEDESQILAMLKGQVRVTKPFDSYFKCKTCGVYYDIEILKKRISGR